MILVLVVYLGIGLISALILDGLACEGDEYEYKPSHTGYVMIWTVFWGAIAFAKVTEGFCRWLDHDPDS